MKNSLRVLGLLALCFILLYLTSFVPQVQGAFVIIQEEKQPTVSVSDIKLFVEGDLVTPNVLIFEGGTSYLPVRKIAEALNLEVAWSGKERTISIAPNKSDRVIKKSKDELPKGNQYGIMARSTDIKLFVNGKRVDKTVMVIEGRSYLPLRVICEELGLNVKFDAKHRAIDVTVKDKILYYVKGNGDE